MNIRCRKIDCKFNQAGTCHAKEVCVCRGADCETYCADKSKQNLEIADELTPVIPNNVPLHCKAEICLYHHDGRCCANGIAIIDNEQQNKADCATFIER